MGYSKLPLPRQPDLAASLPAAAAAPALDIDTIATLAVLNNPELRAARAAREISAAQAFAAGLLPDPQLSGSFERPTDGEAGLVDGYGLGISIDLQALLTHADRAAAADAALEQARLELLWQEWQTVAEARRLYALRVLELGRLQFLKRAESVYAGHAARSGRALQSGDVSLEQAGGDAALLADVRTQYGSAEREAAQADSELHALLGIAPDVKLPLQPLPAPVVPRRAELMRALEQVAATRPDLRALQAGYASQEAQMRSAVLAQFPNVSLDLSKARGTDAIHSNGIGVSLSLPLFDRGRGEIAIQQASREQLRAEYQARLDQATAEAWQLWDGARQLQRQIIQAQRQSPLLRAALDNARKAWEAGDLSAASYLSAFGAWLGQQSAIVDLRASLWSGAIALGTVLGTQVPPAESTGDSSR